MFLAQRQHDKYLSKLMTESFHNELIYKNITVYTVFKSVNCIFTMLRKISFQMILANIGPALWSYIDQVFLHIYGF